MGYYKVINLMISDFVLYTKLTKGSAKTNKKMLVFQTRAFFLSVLILNFNLFQ